MCTMTLFLYCLSQWHGAGVQDSNLSLIICLAVQLPLHQQNIVCGSECVQEDLLGIDVVWG